MSRLRICLSEFPEENSPDRAENCKWHPHHKEDAVEVPGNNRLAFGVILRERVFTRWASFGQRGNADREYDRSDVWFYRMEKTTKHFSSHFSV